MKVILNISLIFFLLIPISGFAQESDEDDLRFRKKIRRTAEKQIVELHDNGALLVRLKTKNNQILALQNAGKNELAERVENHQKEKNLKIVKAFKDEFDFCPVYFFYSDFSKSIKSKNFSEVEFLNHDLQFDSIIKINNEFFLTAEVGFIESDTTKRFSNYYYTKEDEQLVQKPTYHTGTSMGFEALLIKNDKFIQLRRPFPFYIRTLSSLPIFNRRSHTVVRKMNEELHFYYYQQTAESRTFF